MITVKILFLCELFHPHIGGCEIRFYELGKRLAKKGHTINVLTIRYDPNLPKMEEIDGMTVHRITDSFNYITKSGWRSATGVAKYSLASLTKSLTKEIDFDIIFSNEWPITHSLLLAPLYRNILVQDWAEVWTKKILHLQRLLAKLTKHHTTVSNFTKERMQKLLKIPTQNITLIPNGIDPKQFYEKEKEWGTITYIGRFAPHKRIDLLIQSFIKAQKQIPSLKLLLAGSGFLLSHFKNKYDGKHNIKFLGEISDEEKKELLAKSWLFILTSEREGYGIAVLEALASGTPVLLADFPENAAKELISEGGGIVEKPNPQNLANKIIELYKNTTMYENLKSKTRKIAQNYDWNKNAEKLEKTFKRILKETP